MISLSVCDFDVGLNCILFRSVIVPNNGSDRQSIQVVCEVYVYLCGVTYQISLLQTFAISFIRYLVIKENKRSKTFWEGNRKYIFCFLSIVDILSGFSSASFDFDASGM